MIGKVVGNYKIVQALGEGGVGMVYKGVDTMLDREVAIKVLRPELSSQTSVVERFRSEAVTLAKLSHPNIATLYSLFRHGDDLFMVLEFIKGETLDQILHRRRSIPTDEAIPIFCQALEGINYAHSGGIVHRDIKPGNMMLTENGILKVLDFGIARLLGSNRMTRVGNVIGTLEYMSPEQVRGLETDARSDVYGLGIMLYEMLTGRLPFESENDFELMKMQTELLAVPPRQINPDIPVEVEAVILKSIEKKPDDRFASAGDFLNALLDLGFALPNTTIGFGTVYGIQRTSRPSNPGIPVVDTNTIAQTPTDTAVVAAAQKSTDAAEISITGENRSGTGAGIKGTRLAGSVVKGNEPKETRLGNVAPVSVQTTESVSQGSSPVKSWMLFAGVGTVAGLIVIVLLGGIAFFALSGTDEKKPSVNQAGKTEPAPAQTPLVASPQRNTTPEIVAEPTVSAPQPERLNIPVAAENTPEPTNDGSSAAPPKNRDNAKTSPPPPEKGQPRKPAAPQRQKPVESGKKDDLRRILTDN